MHQLDPIDYGKLAMCFAPNSAAIIGASTNPAKMGGRALKFCLTRGYQGRLYPVNAKNDIVQGVDAYASIADLPEAPDIAVIAVPAAEVRDCLVAAGEKGAKVAVVYGAQFAEIGDKGKARQDELLTITEEHGMRLVGPNCMGIMSMTSGFVASFTTAPEHHDGEGWPEVGSISVASQSGAVGIQMLAQLRDRGLGLANWISTGNQADIDIADCIAFFAGDPDTKTIAVYMEDASRGFKLLQALELAREAKKPTVILKVGTTPQGGRAAAGHTASMYVEDRVVDDLFAQYGVLRASSVNELIDLVAVCNTGIVPDGPEVAAVSVSGGGAVMIADAAKKGGLTLPDFSTDALAELRDVNPFVNDKNPIDISAPSMRDMDITGGHLEWGTARGYPAMLGYISHIPLVPRTRDAIMPKLLALTKDHPDQLVALAANLHDDDRASLVKTGMAVFDDPTVATEAIAKLVKAGVAFRRSPVAPAPPEELARYVSDVLTKAGINFVEERTIASIDDAKVMLAQHGRIVLKLSAPTLEHRTDIGGVETSLATEEAVTLAHGRLHEIAEMERINHPFATMLVQPHVVGVEMLLGVRQDPHFGPVIMLGSGGTLAELVDDLTYLKTPIDEEQAAAMIERTRASGMLDGWRGAAAVDRQALIRVLVSLSKAAAPLPSLEINPLIVTQKGVIAVDLLVA